MPDQTITCPSCKELIPLSDALTHQIEEKLRKQVTAEQKKKETELAKQEEVITAKEKELEKTKTEVDESVRTKVAKQLQQEKVTLWEKAQKEAKEKVKQEQSAEMKMITESLTEKDKELQSMRQAEIDLRKEKTKLENDKKAMELENARKLDTERKKIAEDATKQANESYRLKEAEKDKQLQDARKANEELRRKLEQGSQQTQGEVLELELEDFLKNNFPFDDIEPVPTGVNGADVLQRVHSETGKLCGTIIWESKRTKTWSEPWIAKLKGDQRTVKAEIAVLVSEVLPKDVNGFEYRDGVWVCSYPFIANLTIALRMQIIEIASAKQLVAGKEGKMEVLYKYVTSTEFVHRVQAIVEGFSAMQADLQKERVSAERQWSKREKQIQQVISNTSGMYGDLQGLIGTSMQAITALESGEEEAE
ncbi:MAG: DUF2130 domain-containing protein [Nitrospirae bacterium]|nr:DUF2130 domain-containing protein [Nitrospirota bacterium]